jgi:hypothetical protein
MATPSETPETPDPRRHANVIAENLRRIDQALPLEPLSHSSQAQAKPQQPETLQPQPPESLQPRQPEDGPPLAAPHSAKVGRHKLPAAQDRSA